MVIYTPGWTGMRLQRAEEGELRGGCHHRKLYCMLEKRDTATKLSIKLHARTTAGSVAFTAQCPSLPDSHVSSSSDILILILEELRPLFNHSLRICQQVVPSNKSSYAHLPDTLSVGRFLRGPVTPPLTQIGNVTHIQEN